MDGFWGAVKVFFYLYNSDNMRYNHKFCSAYAFLIYEN